MRLKKFCTGTKTSCIKVGWVIIKKQFPELKNAAISLLEEV